MKKLVIGLLVLGFFGFVFAEEKYEITEVDILSLGKLPLASEVSVLGISLGDSMQSTLTKLSMHPKKVKKAKKAELSYFLDIGSYDYCRIRSKDNKTVHKIELGSKFKGRLKGKTAEFYDANSEARLKSFVKGCLGEPDWNFTSGSEARGIGFSLYVMFYEELGFVFMRSPLGENSISLLTNDAMSAEIDILRNSEIGRLIPKGEDVEEEEEIIPPKIESTTGFRQALWGMSKEEVNKIETSEFLKEDKGGGDFAGLEMLIYKTEIGTLDAFIVYYFAKNLLTRARYLIMEDHTNKNLYLEDFKSIKSQLTSKYGNPERDDSIWSDDLYKDNPSDYGMAISVGHLMYVAEWYPPETEIQLLLKGDNYEINLWVEYTSDALREFDEKVREKAKRDIW